MTRGIGEARAPQAGCANGGGQLAEAGETRAAARARVDRVAATYHATALVAPAPVAADLAHTRYHHIPPLEAAAKW